MKAIKKVKELVEKGAKWISESGRYKHILVGFVIGVASCHAWSGIYGALAAGLAAEYKDREWGGKSDIADLLCTVFGGIVGSMVWM